MSGIVRATQLVDVFAVNSYFYIDSETKHGFVIDPGAEADYLLELIKQNAWTIERILLTHGHIDHIGAVETLHQQLGIPYLIHELGERYLTNLQWSLCAFYERAYYLPEAIYLKDGDSVSLEANPNFKLTLMHTPGHTQDSSTYYSAVDGLAFVGDTIFKGSPGSTEYIGSSVPDLERSIARLLTLPRETRLYSGHSSPTTVGAEYSLYL